MIEDVILAIKQAEYDAEESIRLAKETAKAELDAAEEKCASKIAECKKQAKQDIKNAVVSAEKAASERMAQKESDAMTDGKSLLADSQSKVDQAVAIVVERIMAKYGNR